MKIKDYEKFTQQINNTESDNININLLHLLTGLTSEVGEVNQLIQKRIRKHKDLEIDKIKMKEELGDVLWYVVCLARLYDTNIEDIIKFNIEKLHQRGLKTLKDI